MKWTQDRRSTTRLERAGIWLAIALVSAVAMVSLAWIGFLAIQNAAGGQASSIFLLASALGLVALALLIASAFYSLRKRALQEGFRPRKHARQEGKREGAQQEKEKPLRKKLPGSMMAWLQSHVVLGVLALVVALLHMAVLPVTTAWSAGKLALIVLGLLVLSGIAWRRVYGTVPPQVARKVRNLSVSGTRRKIAVVEVELDKLAAGKSPALRSLIDTLRAQPSRLAELDHAAGGLAPGDREAWSQARALVRKRAIYEQREPRQRYYTRLLQGWRWLHIPLVLVLLVALVAHGWDVLRLVGRAQVSDTRSLAAFELRSSQACGRCHKDIVEEWRKSNLAKTQLNPVVIAQTNMVATQVPEFAQQPEFARFCNNCHAPVGTQITGRATLPLDDRFGGPATPHAILDDGVTCIACHAWSNAPNENHGVENDFLGTHASTLSYMGELFGPSLDSPPPVPVPYHQARTGFMTSGPESSQLCGACHDVKLDLDHDGLEPNRAAPNTPDPDDLVLQQTFDEWQDARVSSCVDCHMDSPVEAPISQAAPLIPGARPIRRHRPHTFSVPLKQAATLAVVVPRVEAGQLTAEVQVTNRTGHKLPTGFTFMRQVWLEVWAETGSGGQVCLKQDPNGIDSKCASGHMASATEDLRRCPPYAAGSQAPKLVLLNFAPRDACDPWLVNFQTVLTEGDTNDDGKFEEVPYQSLHRNLIQPQTRVADGKSMAPLEINDPRPPYEYSFDVSDVRGQEVVVHAVLHWRRVAPYFVREFDGYYPSWSSTNEMLDTLRIEDIAEATSTAVRVP